MAGYCYDHHAIRDCVSACFGPKQSSSIQVSSKKLKETGTRELHQQSWKLDDCLGVCRLHRLAFAYDVMR
ncbi:hypothetical protein BRADI_3g57367v3 [Brachypodium distachyon]|uniref:Uncharacterized protein n=1 Tax=Brachypodium distachyon TaxID=15368 RepID=A0A2K2D5H9_BRADI|nr:hypothetical protein BRADI_3g57367v3 [Brachypodium distachyon]